MNFMRFTPISVLLLAAVCAGARPADDLLASTLAKIDQAAAQFKGMTANVSKTSHTEAFAANDTDTGTMAVKRTKGHELRALTHITAPDEKIVELNGHSGRIYYPKSNTVQIGSMDKKMTTMVDELVLLGFGSTSRDMQSAYNIKLGGEEMLNGQKAVRLELTPKKPERLPDITRIELWISPVTGMAVQQKYYEHGGDYILAEFTDMKLVPNLPDSAVTLSLPKDVHKDILR
jgi:outer membrane lipoprotein-sorting protein